MKRSVSALLCFIIVSVGFTQPLVDTVGKMIEQKEKIITMSSGESRNNTKGAILDDIKSIDNAIIENHKEISKLESRLHKMAGNDAKLKKMIDNLTREIAIRRAIFDIAREAYR